MQVKSSPPARRYNAAVKRPPLDYETVKTRPDSPPTPTMVAIVTFAVAAVALLAVIVLIFAWCSGALFLPKDW
jgi:hypothetical protein